MMKHQTISIRDDNDAEVLAQAPLIISASRATDIPAFYADWFFRRLDRGYVRWRNPFSGQDSYVSFGNTRFIIFWSKNPAPLLPCLPMLKERGIGCYIQFTLNDYEAEGLEPNVPTSAHTTPARMAASTAIPTRLRPRHFPIIRNLSQNPLLTR